MTAIQVVVDLPFLASEINDAHKQVQYHAKGMLLDAKRAGEALIAAKEQCRHGEFKAWVENNTHVSFRTAQRYMRVYEVSSSKCVNLDAFEGGVVAFLDAHATKREEAPKPPPQDFTREDAEWVLKVNARAERGDGGERDVAKRKLEEFAKGFGGLV
ncbi:DUF3102 domain-containing protein [Azospirillum sp.]|uniref:DUF3102 domain-containing protein n=1 Tax=Azospirillum sp. TaxID=34012 RepID=UPI003D70E1E4